MYHNFQNLRKQHLKIFNTSLEPNFFCRRSELRSIHKFLRLSKPHFLQHNYTALCMTNIPSRKHLVLVGTGRAHLDVLKRFAINGVGGLAVTLIASHPDFVNETMLPRHLLGEVALDEVVHSIDSLISACGVDFIGGRIQAIDPQEQRLHLDSGEVLPYDTLSLNAEPEFDRDLLEKIMPGVRANALFVYPRHPLLQMWPQLQSLALSRPLQIAVLGYSKSAVELSLAAAEMMTAPHGSRITLLTQGHPLLPGAPSALRKCIVERLKALNITVLHDVCTALSAKGLQLENGASLVCDAPILALESNTPAWLQDCGVKLNESGQIALNQRLQSESHNRIFVTPYDAPPEAGPALAINLNASMLGGTLRSIPATPEWKTMCSGVRRAVFTLGPWVWEGHAAWRWKAQRDRKQQAQLLSKAPSSMGMH